MQTGATPSDETYTHLQVTPTSPDISTVRTQNHPPLYDCDEFFALTWHANSITPVLKCCPPSSRSKLESAIRSSSGAASLAVPSLCGSQSLYLNDTGQELRSLGTPMEVVDGLLPIAEFGIIRMGAVLTQRASKRIRKKTIGPTSLSRCLGCLDRFSKGLSF